MYEIKNFHLLNYDFPSELFLSGKRISKKRKGNRGIFLINFIQRRVINLIYFYFINLLFKYFINSYCNSVHFSKGNNRDGHQEHFFANRYRSACVCAA